MIVSQFQSWAKTASPPSRADGVSALAGAFLYSELTDDQRRDTVRALTTFLDDSSPLVRRALADAFASAIEAPHHIVLALADDLPSIAGIVLGRSPVLSDAELVEFVEGGSAETQSFIASRPYLSSAVLKVLVEVAGPEPLVVLASHATLDLPPQLIARMAERHGSHAALREALLTRSDLPVAVRVEFVAATAGALAAFVTRRNWMSDDRAKRVTREAAERATVALAATERLDQADLEAIADGLRSSGQLTAALALRVLLSGNAALFRAILCDLAGMAPMRVEGFMRHFESTGFAALYRRAGLPLPLLPAFRAALAALRDGGDCDSTAALSRPLVARVLSACEAIDEGQFDSLIVLLRRFDTEAARDEARIAPPLPATLVPTIASKPLPRVQRDIAMLSAISFDEAVPLERQVQLGEPRSPCFTIDLAAIEAELLAA